jgi:hypothetical protein
MVKSGFLGKIYQGFGRFQSTLFAWQHSCLFLSARILGLSGHCRDSDWPDLALDAWSFHKRQAELGWWSRHVVACLLSSESVVWDRLERETGLLNLLLSGAHGEDLTMVCVWLRVLTSDAKDWENWESVGLSFHSPGCVCVSWQGSHFLVRNDWELVRVVHVLNQKDWMNPCSKQDSLFDLTRPIRSLVQVCIGFLIRKICQWQTWSGQSWVGRFDSLALPHWFTTCESLRWREREAADRHSLLA